MAIWKIHAALPGLNVPFYIEADEQPTHEQINEVWMRDSETPLKSPAESRALPLRDAYPSYVQIERLKVATIAATHGWTEWSLDDAGPPLPAETMVDVELRCGEIIQHTWVDSLNWGLTATNGKRDIVRYRKASPIIMKYEQKESV